MSNSLKSFFDPPYLTFHNPILGVILDPHPPSLKSDIIYVRSLMSYPFMHALVICSVFNDPEFIKKVGHQRTLIQRKVYEYWKSPKSKNEQSKLICKEFGILMSFRCSDNLYMVKAYCSSLSNSQFW